MQLSAAGLAVIKKFEGFRNRTYLDVAGLPTIGYGHRVQAHESFPGDLDETRAAQLLAADVCHAEQAVRRLVTVPLTPGQFDALTDFCFNLGAGRLASSTLLHELNAGRYDAAREQLLHWDFAGGKVNAGIAARRQAEYALWARSEINNGSEINSGSEINNGSEINSGSETASGGQAQNNSDSRVNECRELCV
jgi:lysozyme